MRAVAVSHVGGQLDAAALAVVYAMLDFVAIGCTTGSIELFTTTGEHASKHNALSHKVITSTESAKVATKAIQCLKFSPDGR